MLNYFFVSNIIIVHVYKSRYKMENRHINYNYINETHQVILLTYNFFT
jgi:hypothetical protein